MSNKKVWSSETNKTIGATKKILARLSIRVRTDQYHIFLNILKPSAKDKVLDVGVSSDETLADTNLFEKLYPHHKNLTAATIEDEIKFKKLYPKVNVVRIKPGGKLPFINKQFDAVTSWATIEHVGDYEKQSLFFKELLRVGGKVFITTPYRGCIYEPHTGIFFLHWLPLKVFRMVCRLTGKNIWAQTENLNPLWIKDVKKMLPNSKIKIILYKMFNFLPSHLIITNI